MNSDLKVLRDGTLIASVELARVVNGRVTTTRDLGRVFVYWPFVIFKTDRDVWNLTHAPTGCNVTYHARRKDALATIKQLRKAADFEFTSTRSLKWKKARQRSRHIIKAVRKVA